MINIKNAKMKTPLYHAFTPSKKEMEKKLMENVNLIWNKIHASINAHEADRYIRPAKKPLDTDTPKLSQN
jgi:hypothetical protein